MPEPKPQPISDLTLALKRMELPRTRENVLKIARMLSMTEAETSLALMLVENPEGAGESSEGVYDDWKTEKDPDWRWDA